ncbi:hypothetical protein imdm_906 [gamma proteobacterium IMCC2047]|nr:hypothetical protein imdm_906 [gamma proteobacterium IMCC2047]
MLQQNNTIDLSNTIINISNAKIKNTIQINNCFTRFWQLYTIHHELT